MNNMKVRRAIKMILDAIDQSTSISFGGQAMKPTIRVTNNRCDCKGTVLKCSSIKKGQRDTQMKSAEREFERRST